MSSSKTSPELVSGCSNFKTASLLIHLALFFFSSVTLAQQEGNIWYFGANAGLDFNITLNNINGDPVALTDGALFTIEGCSSVSDSIGNLLFYTDGRRVWNKNHAQMPNGFGLKGHESSTQSALIVKQPGNNNIYYIFTTPAQVMLYNNWGFHYSIVDISLEGGLGNVTIKNILLHHPITEKVTAVRHQNGCDIWVITHEYGTNQFRSYLVTGAGIMPPVLSFTGSIHTFDTDLPPFGPRHLSALGQLKTSPDGTKLALAIFEDKKVEVFDFDNQTGIVLNPVSIQQAGSYGVEFSPDGTKLYGSTLGLKEIFQYDLLAGSPIDIINSATLVGSSVAALASLQLAPDGKIYCGMYMSGKLSVINDPNASGIACNFIDAAVDLGGKVGTGGLPNIMQSHLYYQFTFEKNCMGEATLFYITDASNADSVHWDFDDPLSGHLNTSTDLNPTHTFSAPGLYKVKLTKYALCGSTVFYRKVIIFNEIPPVDLGNDTLLCLGQSLKLNATIAGGNSYLWNDGSTTNTFTVSSPGIYWVEVAHACGSDKDTVTVLPNIISVATDSTPATCFGKADGTATVYVSGSYPGYTCLWNDPDAQNAATAIGLAAGTYNVTITDATGCAKDTTITVSQPPAIIINTGAIHAICNGGDDGEATVNVSGGNPAYTYLWNDLNSQQTATATGLHAGVYNVRITDAAGCIKDTIVSVSEPPALAITPNIIPVRCKGEDNGSAIVSVDGGTAPYFYTWSPLVSSNDTARNLSPGNYTLIVNDDNNCKDSVIITINEPDPLTLEISGEDTICEGESTTLSAIAQGGTAPYTYNWASLSLSDSSILVSPSAPTAYTVTVHDINDCATDHSITVNIKPLPVVTFATDLDSGCAPHCVTFNNTTPDVSAITWEFGDGQFDSDPDAYHCYLEAGNYNIALTVTGNNGCTNSLSIPDLIKVFPNPVAGFTMTPPNSAPVASHVLFNDQSTGAIHWFWKFGDFLNKTSTLKNPTFAYTELGSYTISLIVTGNKGCADTISHTIVIEPLFTLYIPNAFTPDSDGLNDFFVVQGAEFDSFEMEIYNRWGERIYHTTEIDRPWDGRVKDGNEIQEGVYVYKIWVKDFKGEIHYYVGNVALLK